MDTPAAESDDGSAAVFSNRRGVVVSFDDHVGAGTVSDSETGRHWWFHCTRLADGSRSIPAGVPVTYGLVPGPTGIEAVDITAA